MSSEDPARTLVTLRRQRGVVKRSVTRLSTNLRSLEATPGASGVTDQAKQLLAKFDSLDKRFQSLHLEIVSFLEEDSADLEKENEVLDRFEDDIAALSLRLKKLSAPSVTAETSAGKQLSRKLIRVKRHLEQTSEGLSMT